MSQLAVGLGLVQGAVIDQHFTQRNRYWRLLSIVAESPSLLGIGIDEDTAAIFAPMPRATTMLRVIGRGVGDGDRSRQHRHQRPRGEALGAAPGQRRGAARAARRGALRPHHALAGPPGDRGRPPRTRRSSPMPARDLRGMARDIAAADASPGALRRRLARSRRRPAHADPDQDGVTPMSSRPTPDITIRETRVYHRARITTPTNPQSTWWSTSAGWRSSPPIPCPVSPSQAPCAAPRPARPPMLAGPEMAGSSNDWWRAPGPDMWSSMSPWSSNRTRWSV